MKRKAQIALNLMPLIAIVLTLAALFAFATFENKEQEKSDTYAKLIKEIEFNQNYIIAQADLIWNETIIECSDCDSEELHLEFVKITKQKEELFRYRPAENFYGKVHREEFEVIDKEDSFVFKMDDVFTEAKVGENRIRREFNLEYITFK